MVVIVLESFAAYKSSLFKNELKASPYFDKLATEGLFFPNYYVPCQATARSMFALVTGLPDLTVSNTSTRNPFLVNQHSIINEFEGYDKLYFLGGSANWGNIRGIFAHNIDGIEIIEEGSFKSPRTDVWGISDYHLMIEANDHLKNRTKPFFAIIQSAGFHRPYTIPSDAGNFKVEKVDSMATLEKNGFISEDEYNSLRFQDYSLGNFIEIAKREKYFDNTIFIMYGDHGLPANQAANINAGTRFHNLENFHVPFLIYAPKLIQPQINTKPMSQMDLLPSIASLIGIPYNNTTLGRNIFDDKIDPNRYLFVYYWYTLPPEFAVFNSEFYYKDNLQNISELYRYNEPSFDKNIKASEPQKAQELQNLARGYFYAAKHLMMNNKKIVK
ncbi:MAG: sulfatase-like hydrolase/transferase [Bacteriovoracaceae bacterium]